MRRTTFLIKSTCTLLIAVYMLSACSGSSGKPKSSTSSSGSDDSSSSIFTSGSGSTTVELSDALTLHASEVNAKYLKGKGTKDGASLPVEIRVGNSKGEIKMTEFCFMNENVNCVQADTSAIGSNFYKKPVFVAGASIRFKDSTTVQSASVMTAMPAVVMYDSSGAVTTDYSKAKITKVHFVSPKTRQLVSGATCNPAGTYGWGYLPGTTVLNVNGSAYTEVQDQYGLSSLMLWDQGTPSVSSSQMGFIDAKMFSATVNYRSLKAIRTYDNATTQTVNGVSIQLLPTTVNTSNAAPSKSFGAGANGSGYGPYNFTPTSADGTEYYNRVVVGMCIESTSTFNYTTGSVDSTGTSVSSTTTAYTRTGLLAGRLQFRKFHIER